MAAEKVKDKEADDADEEHEDSDEPQESGPAKAPSPGGLLGLAVGVGVITLVATGMGVGLGMQTAAKVERTVVAREAAAAVPSGDRVVSVQYSGDMVLHPIEAVVTNLASPSDTWIRLETAMVFKNGAVANPQVTAAELRQDIIAYARTISLAQLDGPSALQHLREDLNERTQLRTGNQVSELVIQSLVVQ